MKLCIEHGVLKCGCSHDWHQWKIQKLLDYKDYFSDILNISFTDDEFLTHFDAIIDMYYQIISKVNQQPSLMFTDSDFKPIDMGFAVFKYNANNLFMVSPQNCEHNHFQGHIHFMTKILSLLHFEPENKKHLNLNKHRFGEYFGLNGCCKQCAVSFGAVMGFRLVEFAIFEDESNSSVHVDRLILLAAWIANALSHYQFVKYVSTSKRLSMILYVLHRLTFHAWNFHEANRTLYLKRRQLICL
eukprot:63661_1